MVNGIVYDFESVKIMLPTGQYGTCEDIKYGAKKDIDVVTDKNGIPRGYIRKGFDSDFEMDMSLDQFEKLNKSAEATGILGMEPIPVTVTMGDGSSPKIVDKLVVKITETPREMKKDSEIRMKIKAKVTEIPLFNGIPVYIAKA